MNRLALIASLLCAVPALAAAPPKIEHTPPEATLGQDVTIKAVIKAAGGVFEPYLYYRKVGEKNFKKISLKPGSNGEFTATIPGSDMTGDLEYYLEAYDQADLTEGYWASKRNPSHLGAKAAAPKIGTLTVRADPEGAAVEIDGKPVGASPWAGQLAPGQHVLTLSKEGYDPSKMTFTMPSGDFALGPPALHKAAPSGPGKLAVNSSPLGARLLVDDQGQGRAPNTLTLPPGQHKVTAILEGFTSNTQAVNIAPAGTDSVTLTLMPGDLGGARARLEKARQTAPKDADIALNLAQVCDAMRENACAVEEYEAFLANAPASSYQTDVRSRLGQVRAELQAAERASQGLDFVSDSSDAYGVEVRSPEGAARCERPVKAGQPCKLYVPAGRAQVLVSGAASMTREVQVPKGRSEARISKGASAAPIVLGLVLVGAGVGSYFFFDSQRTVNDPFNQTKSDISPVAYVTAGGGVVLGVILFIYGISSGDSIDLSPAAPSGGAKKPPLKFQFGAAPTPGGMTGMATLKF